MKTFEDITHLAKALSDENRVKIVTLIQREDALCVCEICDTLNLSQPLVSRHLKQLRAVEALDSSREGKWIIYTIVKDPSPILESYLSLLKEKEESLNTLIGCTTR